MSTPTADQPKSTPWWLLLVGTLLAFVPPIMLGWGFYDLGEQRLARLASWLYWWMALVCGFAVLCFGWRWTARQTSFCDCLRLWWPGIALAIVATVVVFLAAPPQMRVQFDETSIVGVSQNMHQQRLAVMTTGAVPYRGEFVPQESMVDKRPTLFAFLVSLVHDVRGYRIENAYLVNGLLLALGLFVLFVGTRQRLGLLAGLSAPLLVLAVPLTCVVATSAGFELLATVLLLSATVAALGFVEKPSDARCAAFLGTAMLLAQSRYESIVAVALLGALSAACTFRRYRPSRWVWCMLALCPTLLTPLFFLLQHAQAPNFTPEAGGQSLVSFAHLVSHTGPLILGWFAISLDNPLPGLMALVAVAFWVVRLWRREASVVDLFMLVPLALTVLVLAWFYGDVREVTALRLFLPLAWASVLPLLVVPIAAWRRSKRIAAALLVVSVALFAIRLPRVADGSVFPQLPTATLTAELDRLLKRLPGDPATTLFVGAPAQHLIIKGYAAISVATYQRMGQGIASLQRQGDVGRVYLLETALDGDMEPVFGSPRALLRTVSSRVVERIGGVMPITVHELGR